MSNILLYNASAGSGKTFQLTRRFLELAFSRPGSWKRILAVTFTNKATLEMKTRILAELETLACTPTKSAHYLALCTAAGCLPDSPAQLQELAQQCRREILLNYHRLSVMTLDSFLQRLLRSMAREINLSAGYRVELDIEEIKQWMLHRFISELKEAKDSTLWTLEFLHKQMEDNKHWDLRKALNTMAGQWFSESFQEDLSAWDAFQQEVGVAVWKKELERQHGQWQDSLRAKLKALEAALNQQGIQTDDFSHKKSGGVPGLIKSIDNALGNTTNAGLNPLGKRTNDCYHDSNKWFGNKAEKDLKTRGAACFQVFKDAYDAYQNALPSLISIQALRKQVYQVGLLQEMKSALQQWREEAEAMPISDAAPLLQAVVANNPVSFVFEKWGNRFDHFLVDELQDTSRLQWANLQPLIENGLSQGFSSMLVGDTKQAIYRFRNGDANLMASQVPDHFGEQLQKVPMTKNYRSLKGIVDFNAQFFSQAPLFISELMSNNKFDDSLQEKIKLFYREVHQEIGKPEQSDRTSHIGITLLQSTGNSYEAQQKACFEACFERIKALLQQNMPPTKMALLFRNNKEIAQFTGSYKTWIAEQPETIDWPEIASEGVYRLSKHPAVRILIAVLEACRFQGNQVAYAAAYRDISQLLHGVSGIPQNQHPANWAINEHWQNAFRHWRLQPTDQVLRDAAAMLNVYDQAGWSPFVRKLIDLATERSQKDGNLPVQFLAWWKTKEDQLNLPIEEMPGTIRAMTIHKSKGLEFEVVLIPFLNASQRKGPGDLIWLAPDSPKEQFPPKAPLILEKNLDNSWFHLGYQKELAAQQLDVLNHLYVAFTRAVGHLHVWALFRNACQNQEKEASFPLDPGCLIFKTMKALGLPLEETEPNVWAWKDGAPSLPRFNQENLPKQYIPEGPAAPALRNHPGLSVKGMPDPGDFDRQIALRRGLIFHRLAAGLGGPDSNPQQIVQTALAEGWMEGKEEAFYTERLKQVLALPQLQETSLPPWKVWNEASILLPNGETKRPDRVAIHGKAACIIDYKTGEPKSEHVLQMESYQQLLQSMGYEPIQAHLIYLDPLTVNTLT